MCVRRSGRVPHLGRSGADPRGLLAWLLLLGLVAAASPRDGRAQEPRTGAHQVPEPVRGLDAYVRRSMESWQAPGLSLVVVRGDSVSARGYGVTESGGSVPVTPETLFGIGSLSKAFTATLMAMLVDEGRIGWDDPVVRHLPGFAMHDPYVTRRLTIRDILSHRTGLSGDDLVWVAGERSPEELVRRLRFQKAAFGFRERFGYNNLMYLVAAELAEEVTGEPWAQLMRRRIFEPLGMTLSTPTIGELRRRSDVALPHDEIGPGQLLGTAPSTGVPLDAPDVVQRIDWFDPVTAPGGGIASSASEFAAWLRLHLGSGELDGKRLVGAEALLETRTPQMTVPGFARGQTEPSETNLGAYGMGWGVRDYRGRLMVSHLGSTPGWSAAVALLPAEGVGVAVFVNLSRGTALADAVQKWLLDRLLSAPPTDWSAEAARREGDRRKAARAALEEVAAARSEAAEPSLALTAYAGTYVDSLYPTARVDAQNGGLRLVLGPHLAGDLEHWERDTFRVTWDRPELGANLVGFKVEGGDRAACLETRILGQHGTWHRRGRAPGTACRGGAPDDPVGLPSPSDSLIGLWELEASKTIAPDGSVRSGSPRESFLLFTAEHYSMNWVSGGDSISSYDEPFRPTEKEALARYGSLLVNAGRYTASEGTLTIEPIFALVPEFINGSGIFAYSLSGDTLKLRWTRIFAADGSPDPLTAQGYSFRYRFARVKIP